MKKQVFRIAVVFSLLCLSTSLKAQRTDAKDQGLKGPVTSVMTKDYGFTTSFGEKKQGELKEVSIYIFDSKGNITKESTKDGAFIYKNNYDKGKLISQDLLNGDGSLHQKIKYAYTLYIIRCKAGMWSCISCESNKNEVFLKNNWKKFWRFGKTSYLCIRFRDRNIGEAKRKSSLKRLHKNR
jgi:hypothetical protein